jgi:hypothetical protein
MQLSAAEQKTLMSNLATQQTQAAETAKAQLAQQQKQYARAKDNRCLSNKRLKLKRLKKSVAKRRSVNQQDSRRRVDLAVALCCQKLA